MKLVRFFCFSFLCFCSLFLLFVALDHAQNAKGVSNGNRTEWSPIRSVIITSEKQKRMSAEPKQNGEYFTLTASVL